MGVGAVIVHDGEILLVKRGSDPGRGKWSIPGGMVELEETVRTTVVREVKEETNLNVEVNDLIDVVDNTVHDKEGRLRFHFVILDFYARLKDGQLRAGSDVLDVKWVPLNSVETLDLTQTFREFFQRNRQTLEQYNSTN